MKILQIINSLGTGGAEKLLLELMPLYHDKGIQMDVLLLWDNDLPFAQELKKLNCCKVYTLKKSNNYKDIYSLSHMVKMRKIMKEYDLIHVHLFPAQYFAAIANIGLGKKLIFTEHSTSNKRINNPFFSVIDKKIYNLYVKVITISEAVNERFKTYIGADKLTVINNGVNINKIKLAPQVDKKALHHSFSQQDFVLSQVSAFRKGKDQLTIIKSLALLPPDVKLILVGTGDETEKIKIENCIQELNLTHRVFLLGQRMDVSSIIKSVDINILSSEFEGLSLASVEGLASGKPFVASDVPGLTEIVKGAGILFPLGKEELLANIILELKNNTNFAEQTAKSGWERAKEYDITNMLNNHITLYKKIYNS